MGGEERMKNMKENMGICICQSCPVYNDCAKEKHSSKPSSEILFCALSKSKECITAEIGDAACICPQCPLTEKMGLKNIWFCTRGSEREQRGM